MFYYHWAPSSRRNAISRSGMLPGKWSTDRLWKPPYVCFAEYPELAWILSGRTSRGKVIPEWDLWQADLSEVSGFEELYFDTGNVQEVRVYERIFKRNLWLVGQRSA